jgi:TonB family protein
MFSPSPGEQFLDRNTCPAQEMRKQRIPGNLALSRELPIQERLRNWRTLEESRMKRELKKARILGSALLAMALGLGVANLGAQESRKVLLNPVPVYPETAKKFRLSGVVKVQIVIAPDGHIKETKVIGGHPLLVFAVEDTLRGWKYAPASSETTMQLEFNFHP